MRAAWLSPSRKLGLAARQHYFNAEKNGHKIGEYLTCRVVSVGPRLCMVECGGRDMTLKQADLTLYRDPLTCGNATARARSSGAS